MSEIDVDKLRNLVYEAGDLNTGTRQNALSDLELMSFDLAQAYLDLLERVEWRPIETAPKDGTHIQLYRPEIQFVGYWSDAGWCMQGCKMIDPAPTHWMPLPQPVSEG